jgi:hypothetical protein
MLNFLNLLIDLLPKQAKALIIVRFLRSATFKNNADCITVFSIANYLQMSPSDIDVLLSATSFRAVDLESQGEGE